jgi:hypothetical protein
MLGNVKEIYDGLCFLGVYISIPNIAWRQNQPNKNP